ncbi:MAG: ABC transporter ATP-binding protein [Pirellulales bacterium]|nr:ABC transporter ATP-binding protein [Pirellulales bacterium]
MTQMPAVDSSPAIEVRELCKTYRSGLFGRSVEALRGVSLQVGRGEIFGLLGPNGAGKTTLIKILLGIVRRSKGHAMLLGQPAGRRTSRREVGYLPENHRIPRHHTGNSALEYYAALSDMPSAEIRRRRPELLDLVGLREWGRTSVRQYSKGMLQRLGLAQALMHDPQLLILDEPTDGVDPLGRAEMRALLVELKARGKTIFINSHLLQEIELVCDRVAILHKGEVVAVGGIAELTRGKSTSVVFELSLPEGADQSWHAALEGLEAAVSGPKPGGIWRVQVAVSGQEDVDHCVDRLRQAGVSIVSISPHKLTLEEAFLGIIHSTQNTLVRA